jgi:biopolymer transport protein ExbD
MNFRKGAAREEPEINLIPLIDLFLVIIIFLMVTTTYSRFTELQITLPTADAEKAQQRPTEIDVGVTATGTYSIDGKVTTAHAPEDLAQLLRQAAGGKREPMLVIAADAQSTHQSVISVMEAARLANIPQITFSTQTAQGK